MTYLDTPKNNLINWLNNKLKKTLIYKISVRQLGLKFKWDNTLESKAIALLDHLLNIMKGLKNLKK